MKIRLNRYLAMCGLGSRRKCDELIARGEVSVNGEVVTQMGVQVDPDCDEVRFRGEKVQPEKDFIYILLNKPLKTVTTASDEKRRKTVLDVVNVPVRIFPVGRLDYNTTGALLLTNDGELAYFLAHPKFKLPKVYHVLLDKRIRQIDLHYFRKGLDMGDFVTAPCRAEELRIIDNKSYLEVEIHEGKNRQIRRMFAKLGYQVEKLERVEFAGLRITGLKPGEWRRLTNKEVTKLRKLVNERRQEVLEDLNEKK